MKRIAAALVSGIVLGGALVILTVGVLGGWYEYAYVNNAGPSKCAPSARDGMLQSGWVVVPDQTDVCYFRRARLFH